MSSEFVAFRGRGAVVFSGPQPGQIKARRSKTSSVGESFILNIVHAKKKEENR
jgi:hypothetical protein